MKRLFYLLSLTLLISSCTNKDELLISKKWVLHHTFDYSDKEKGSKMSYHKKADEVLTLKFNTDGTLRITEEGKRFGSCLWEWKNDKYITLNKGKFQGDWHVLDLSSSELKWTKSDIYSKSQPLHFFRHLDDEDWDDNKIEMINNLK